MRNKPHFFKKKSKHDNSEPYEKFTSPSSSHNLNYNPTSNPSNSFKKKPQNFQNFGNSQPTEDDEENNKYYKKPQTNKKPYQYSNNYQESYEQNSYQYKNYQKPSQKSYQNYQNSSQKFVQNKPREEDKVFYLTMEHLDNLRFLESNPQQFLQSFMSLTPLNRRLDKTRNLKKLMIPFLEVLSILLKIDSHETIDLLKDCFDSNGFRSALKEELEFHQAQKINENKYKIILVMLRILYDLFLYIIKHSRELVNHLSINEVSETIDMFLIQRPDDVNLSNFKDKFADLKEYVKTIKREVLMNKLTEKKNTETFEKNYDVQITYSEADVYPTEYDCLNTPKQLPFFPHIIKGPYPSTDVYLNNMFHLLKQDFMIGIRKSFEILQGNENSKKFDLQIFENAYLYKDVKIQDVIFGDNGIFLKVLLTPWLKKQSRSINWMSTKRMTFGSLMIITDETFDKMFFATVFEKPPGEKMNTEFQKYGNIEISIKGLRVVENENLVEMINDLNRRKLMIIEAKTYFESYYHFLRQIQNIDPENMPFNEIIVKAKTDTVEIPNYLKTRDMNNRAGDYIFDLDFEKNPGGVKKKMYVLQEKWPESMKNTLDDSQYKALKNILTKNVSIIQGPPGTGKT